MGTGRSWNHFVKLGKDIRLHNILLPLLVVGDPVASHCHLVARGGDDEEDSAGIAVVLNPGAGACGLHANGQAGLVRGGRLEVHGIEWCSWHHFVTVVEQHLHCSFSFLVLDVHRKCVMKCIIGTAQSEMPCSLASLSAASLLMPFLIR